MKLAPIALFIYNRPDHTRLCLQSLMNNPHAKNSKLYVFADGPKPGSDYKTLESIKEARQVIMEKNWCGEIKLIERDENLGLAKSIITGVNEILSNHDRIIVLEDDLILSTGFLEYMNAALQFYESEPKVFHISGFIYPIPKSKLPDQTFFLHNASCLGWGTWKRAWSNFNPDASDLLSKIPKSAYKDFNFGFGLSYIQMLKNAAAGKISSWAVRWYASIFINNGLSLHPNQSLVNNSGFDGSGVHSGIFDYQWNDNLAEHIKVTTIPLEISYNARKAIKKFYLTMKFYWKLEGLILRLGLYKYLKTIIVRRNIRTHH